MISSPNSRRSIPSIFITTAFKSTTFSATNWRRLKASSCLVRPAARSAAFFTSSISRRMGSPATRRLRISSLYPRMTVRRLLKSWATPPASRPTASIFCDCRSCASAWCSASLAFARSPNCSILSSTSAAMLSSLLSGSRMLRLKNSITPSTSPPRRSGNPKAPCSPACAADAALGKLESARTSVIHAGCPLFQILPGSPTPYANDCSHVAITKSSASSVAAFH